MDVIPHLEVLDQSRPARDVPVPKRKPPGAGLALAIILAVIFWSCVIAFAIVAWP
jgi:hypothetical protein